MTQIHSRGQLIATKGVVVGSAARTKPSVHPKWLMLRAVFRIIQGLI
jgi:hypothetical protein